MDGRFNQIASSRGGFSPFGTTGYEMGLNLELGLSPSFVGSSNFGNSLGYARMSSPYYSGSSNRYSTPIGYSGGNGRGGSLSSSTNQNVWGSGSLNNLANSSRPVTYMGSRSGAFGDFGNSNANWGPSPVSTQGRGSPPGYNSGTIEYGNGESGFNLAGGGYRRNSSSSVAQSSSSLAASTVGYEGSYGNFHRSGSVYGDSTWRSATPELVDVSGSFGYGLGNISSDVTSQSSEGYIGSYNVASRKFNRGKTLSSSNNLWSTSLH